MAWARKLRQQQLLKQNGFTAFESIAQLVSYSGYDVIENQSDKRTGKTKISKKATAESDVAYILLPLT